MLTERQKYKTLIFIYCTHKQRKGGKCAIQNSCVSCITVRTYLTIMWEKRNRHSVWSGVTHCQINETKCYKLHWKSHSYTHSTTKMNKIQILLISLTMCACVIVMDKRLLLPLFLRYYSLLYLHFTTCSMVGLL